MKFIRLHCINKRGDGSYYLSDIRVNPSHIAVMTENVEFSSDLREGKMNLNLHKAAEFTDIMFTAKMSGKKITVVGSLTNIEEKINSSKRNLLRD